MPSRIAFAACFILITISLFLFSACSYPYDDDTLRREDAPPVADAGADQEVSTGVVVTLDGSGSSGAANAMLSYFWEFASLPASSMATLSSSDGVAPSFVADVDGTYVLQLVVNDGSSDSASDTVMIVAASAAVPVSFSADIQPIFDSNCTACHNGGISPDLTSGNAYSSLVNQPTASSSGSSDTLVVPGVSGNSELYLRVAGTSTGDQMPSGSSLSSTDQDSIRTWIDEGAENN